MNKTFELEDLGDVLGNLDALEAEQKAKQQEYRKRHAANMSPEQIQANKAAQRRLYYIQRKERIAAGKQWRLDNPEKARAQHEHPNQRKYTKRWYKDRPDKVKEYNQKRYKKVKENGGLTPEQRERSKVAQRKSYLRNVEKRRAYSKARRDTLRQQSRDRYAKTNKQPSTPEQREKARAYYKAWYYRNKLK